MTGGLATEFSSRSLSSVARMRIATYMLCIASL